MSDDATSNTPTSPFYSSNAQSGHREAVTSLEELLCVTELQRRKSDVALRQLKVQYDSILSENCLLRHELKEAHDLNDEECQAVQSRYEAVLAERTDLVEHIETLEAEVEQMSKSVAFFQHNKEASKAGAAIEDSNAEDRISPEDESKEILLRQPLGYMNVKHIAGNSLQREQQLLGIVEHSAIVFAAVHKRMSELQVQVNNLEIEKQAWEVNQSGLTASIAILHEEKDTLIARYTKSAIDNALCVQILYKDEKQNRALLTAQCESTLFALAYHRSKADPLVAVKKIQSALDASISDANRAKRMHLLELREATENASVEANRIIWAAEEAHREAMELAKKKFSIVESQNMLLRGTCEEWRQQADSRDHEASLRHGELQKEFDEYRHTNEVSVRQALSDVKRLSEELAVAKREREAFAHDLDARKKSRFSADESVQTVAGVDYEMELELAQKRFAQETAALSQATGAKIMALQENVASLQEQVVQYRDAMNNLELVVVAVEQEKRADAMKNKSNAATLVYENENLLLRSAATERQKEFFTNEVKLLQQKLDKAETERDTIFTPSLEKLTVELKSQTEQLVNLEERHYAAIKQLSEETRKCAAQEVAISTLECRIASLTSVGATNMGTLEQSLKQERLTSQAKVLRADVDKLCFEEELARKEMLRSYDSYLLQRGSMTTLELMGKVV